MRKPSLKEIVGKAVEQREAQRKQEKQEKEQESLEEGREYFQKAFEELQEKVLKIVEKGKKHHDIYIGSTVYEGLHPMQRKRIEYRYHPKAIEEFMNRIQGEGLKCYIPESCRFGGGKIRIELT